MSYIEASVKSGNGLGIRRSTLPFKSKWNYSGCAHDSFTGVLGVLGLKGRLAENCDVGPVNYSWMILTQKECPR